MRYHLGCLLVTAAVLFALSGCGKDERFLLAEELTPERRVRVTAVFTTAGEVLQLEEGEVVSVEPSSDSLSDSTGQVCSYEIVGMTRTGDPVRIPVSDVRSACVRDVSSGLGLSALPLGLLIGVGGAIGATLIVALL